MTNKICTLKESHAILDSDKKREANDDIPC